jgi:hypothetical protein
MSLSFTRRLFLAFGLFLVALALACGSVQHCPDGTVETGRTVGRRQLGDGFLTTEDVRLVCSAVPDGGAK